MHIVYIPKWNTFSCSLTIILKGIFILLFKSYFEKLGAYYLYVGMGNLIFIFRNRVHHLRLKAYSGLHKCVLEWTFLNIKYISK